jgi:multiple sugar transport system substrate-binding protein
LALLSSCQKSSRDYLVFYVWGDSAEVSSYEKIAADFETATGIKVKVEPSTGSYYDNLNISFSSASKAPDLFFTESGEFIGHLSSKKLLDLSPYIADGSIDAKDGGTISLWDLNDAYRYDGTNVGAGDYYALIKDWSPDFVVWYNKSHIDSYNTEHNLKAGDSGFMDYPSATIPMSWDEFMDMSYKLKKENRYGTMLDRVPYKHAMEWVQMTGSSLWSDGKYLNAKDAGVQKAFQFWSDLQVGAKASAPVVGPSGIGSGEAFANGNLSFAFFGSWAYSTYHWDSLPFEFGICPPPTPSAGMEPYCASSGMIALAINNATGMKKEAVQFLNYYMDKGNQYMATKGFNIPGNKQVAMSDAFLHPEESALAKINQYFVSLAEKTHPLIYNKAIPQLTVESKFDKYFSSYLANPSSGNVAAVLENVAEDLKKEL